MTIAAPPPGPTGRWRLYQGLAAFLVFTLPLAVSLITALLASRTIWKAGWPAITTSGQESLYFFAAPQNLMLVGLSGAVTIVLGALAAWTVHTRHIPYKAALVFLLLVPAALPYEAVTWIARTLPIDPVPLAGCVLLYRYLPLSFVFSYLAASQYTGDVVGVSRSLGVSEVRLLRRRVLPTVALPLVAQFLFVTLIMAADHVGMSYASGGQLTSLGNIIDAWSRTTDSRSIAYTIALAAALFGAFAAGGSNVIGWWNRSIRGSVHMHPHASDSPALWGLWIGALILAGTPLAIACTHLGELEGGLLIFMGAALSVVPSTLIYIGIGTSLSAATAFTVYLVVQDRDMRRPSLWLSICVAASMFGLLVPPVLRGDFFLIPTTEIMRSGGNAAWAAFWMWITAFPAIAAVSALHPASRGNRFQSLLEAAGVFVQPRLWKSVGHAQPVIYAAALIWLFFGMFDTSVSRSMAGSDRPFGVWFRDQVSTTYDPGLISAGVISAYMVVLSIGFAALLLSPARREHGR